MSVQVGNYAFTNVGRMYARQNVPSVYNRQQSAGKAASEEPVQSMDSVTLSAQAPRPLTGDFLEQAMLAGRDLGTGGNLSSESEQRLREDRIFAAVTALAMMGYSGEEAASASWPGGIPAPSSEELEVARRRLAQRPRQLQEAANPTEVQNERLTLLERLGKRDSSVLAGLIQPAAKAG